MKSYINTYTGKINTIILLYTLSFVGLLAQPIVTKDLPQYLLSEFAEAEILMKAGNYIGLNLNYNTVTQRMVFKQKGLLYDMVNPQEVDTIFLEERVFVIHDTVFLELVVKDKIPFFIQHKSDVSIKSKPSMSGTTQVSTSNFVTTANSAVVYFNQKLPDNFVVKSSNAYWARNKDEMKAFINERQLLKIFPDIADHLKVFIKESNLKLNNMADFTRIAKYCNDQLK